MKSTAYLSAQIINNLIYSWYGVPWRIVGRKRKGESSIKFSERARSVRKCQKEYPFKEDTCTNCGLFVSTVLKHAGFKIERYKLSRQLSANIIRTFSPKKYIRRPKGGQRIEDFVRKMKSDSRGPGIYIVGLDMHVGFLVNGKVKSPLGKTLPDDLYFCHADYGHIPQVVRCERAVESPILTYSRCRVNGKVLNDKTMNHWLTGRKIPTVGRH